DDPAAAAAAARRVDLSRLDDPELRTAENGQAASRIAAIPEVRAALLEAQRAFAGRDGGAVLDGRDIATVVCPHADVKLFVTADLDTRARRRAIDLGAAGDPAKEKAVRRDLAERDRRDQERAAAPLVPAPGARLLDTSDMSIDAAFDAARRIVDEALADAGSQ
ncbi:MAG: (d)CMP kinase, partial [Caulobacterales bacterium]|nr:(d)CMP kinase [Caulobacterales bacterium]